MKHDLYKRNFLFELFYNKSKGTYVLHQFIQSNIQETKNNNASTINSPFHSFPTLMRISFWI